MILPNNPEFGIRQFGQDRRCGADEHRQPFTLHVAADEEHPGRMRRLPRAQLVRAHILRRLDALMTYMHMPCRKRIALLNHPRGITTVRNHRGEAPKSPTLTSTDKPIIPPT